MRKLREVASDDELASKTYLDFFTPDSLVTIRAEIAKRASGVSSTYEVELEPTLCARSSRAFSAGLYQLLVASNGEEALALFEKSEVIHIVVTDMMMPGMTGAELVNAIDAITPNMRALFMSGYAVDGESILSSRPGAAFIAKPFTLQDLADRIGELLGSQRLLDADRR